MTAVPLNSPLIVHHKAALDDSPYPPNSLEAVRACLEAGADFIEIDVLPLRDRDYLVVHDADLASETTGHGDVSVASVDDVRQSFLRHGGQVTAYRPALLSDLVQLLRDFGGRTRLQIDYKHVLPLRDAEPLQRLVDLIAPLEDRVLVSSQADWHLRKLRRMAGWLDLGFDIGFYLDFRPKAADPRLPPFRLGAYGYHDDHILATQLALLAADYLAERCEILANTVPGVSTWYVSHHLISRALDDGFNLADWLHDRGVRLDAWTLDVGKPSSERASALLEAGVDIFTTNTPVALGRLLRAPR